MMYPIISYLYPENLNNSAYGQVYIVNICEANQIRMKHPRSSEVLDDILAAFIQVLKMWNSYIQS